MSGGLSVLRPPVDGDGIAADEKDDDLLGLYADGLAEAKVGRILDGEFGGLRVHGPAELGERLADPVGLKGVIGRRQLREDSSEQQDPDDQQAEHP